MNKIATVDEYILNEKQWQQSLLLLREILISSKLEENLKWGSPVYSLNNKNVAGIRAFKNYSCIWFFQGALLADKNNKLINAQEGKTKALRQWRFESYSDINENIELIKQYIDEAISNQKLGKEIKKTKNMELIIPNELSEILKAEKEVKSCFEKFTIAKRREFCEYIIEAKRPETKQKRLDKILPMIVENIGLHDSYSRKKK